MRSPSRKHEGRSEKEGVSFSHLWGGPEGHHGLPLLTPERLEQFGVLAEEMATIEIAAPVHYPPSPPGDIECFEFTQDDSEEEEEEVGTPIPTPKTPLPPPQPPAKRPDFGPEGLPTSFSFACGGWLQVRAPSRNAWSLPGLSSDGWSLTEVSVCLASSCRRGSVLRVRRRVM